MTSKKRLPSEEDPDQLHTALSNLVKMYQFRSRDENLFYGVTVSQSYCLRALWKNGKMNMGALAQDLSLSISTLTGVVDQLVKKSLVHRIVDPNDRRIQLIELTKKGLKNYETTNTKFQKHLNKALEGKSQRDKKMIINFLNDITGVIREWRKGYGS